ncbi:MAG: aconitate hydratase [Thermodesulfobacteriota bacterium]
MTSPPKTLFQKILSNHGVAFPPPGEPVSIPIDQTLTQDATGTMAVSEFMALGLNQVRTQLSVSYVDHNTLQTGFANAEDHRFLRTAAARYGMVFSAPGNGICHQVHLERFGAPGRTLLGADSHTCTGGGIGMLAMGAGGLDVALAMAGEPFVVAMPRIVEVRLSGALSPWVSAKDVILEVLRRETVKGGVGSVYEYTGPGVATLSVPERATITNMGAELGATTSLFPSDDRTRAFLAAQGRAEAFAALSPDPDAIYDRLIEINLSELVPLTAQPHMPDRVVPVSELAGRKVDQVMVGSCTNSSYKDLATLARVLKGRTVAPETNLVVSPGSRQVLAMLARGTELTDLITAGARILECACGPCIGAGQAPPHGAVSVRTTNRNFKGRSGTDDAQIFLASPETAAACALTGVFTDPRSLGPAAAIPEVSEFPPVDAGIVLPVGPCGEAEVVTGENIKPLPLGRPIAGELSGRVLLALPDNITTDDILPASSHILQYRSNVPKISEYTFSRIAPDFARRAQEHGGGFVVAGENYGQGSSREHAALAPLYLGIKAVIACSFARIHRANLINFGILPLLLENPRDLDGIGQGDLLVLADARRKVENEESFAIRNATRETLIRVKLDLKPEERLTAAAGGRLNRYRELHGDDPLACPASTAG